ncbi:uncharacterized protein LOC132942688 [Metopolophium dirhodum]|uniref:uncharacterized protein LOC132942688 n=1 Tax=Metopolophium dirhodum TaxID=44670 RepID=UPI00298FD8B7|nr:uncharacterized protein LOC132942688 [Metopolophium dirhodum]
MQRRQQPGTGSGSVKRRTSLKISLCRRTTATEMLPASVKPTRECSFWRQAQAVDRALQTRQLLAADRGVARACRTRGDGDICGRGRSFRGDGETDRMGISLTTMTVTRSAYRFKS